MPGSIGCTRPRDKPCIPDFESPRASLAGTRASARQDSPLPATPRRYPSASRMSVAGLSASPVRALRRAAWAIARTRA